MEFARKPRSFYLNRILIPLFLSCTGWNMVRRCLGEVAPKLIQDGFFNQSNYAQMNTVAFIAYGLSEFASSHIVRGNLFTTYAFFVFIVGLMCIANGLACSESYSSFAAFFSIWVIDYIFIGILWPIICIIFKKWLPDDLRGFFWSIICCCSSIGTILCNMLSQFVNGEPSKLFYYHSIIVITSAVIAYCLSPPEQTTDIEYKTVKSTEKYANKSKVSIGQLTSITLILISVFLGTFNIKVVNDWSLLMFPKIIHNADVASGSAISYIGIGGIFGIVWCGWVSDTYHISRFHICEFASFMSGLIFCVIPYTATVSSFNILSFLLGFFIYIPYSFSELIAMESVDARYTNIVISLNGLMSPLGSVCSGTPMNTIIDAYGWNRIPRFLCMSSFVYTLLLWMTSIIRKYAKDSKDNYSVCLINRLIISKRIHLSK